MVGNAIKCDECGKVDVHQAPNGIDNSHEIRWFKVQRPQSLAPRESLKIDDICSLKCLQQYAEGWTANG